MSTKETSNTKNEDETVDLMQFVTLKLSRLAIERKNWVKGELARSNRKLYGILSKCKELADEIRTDQDKIKQLDAHLKVHQIKSQKNADVYVRVIKAVFGDNRRYASKYAKVLRTADEAKIQSSDLAKWIEKQGGIEAINSEPDPATSATSRSKDKVDGCDAGEKYINDIEVVTTIDHIEGFPKENKLVVLIGRPDAIKHIEILNFFPKQGVLKTICRDAGKKMPEDAGVTEIEVAKQMAENLKNMKASNDGRSADEILRELRNE